MANSVFAPKIDGNDHNAKAIVRGILNELPDDCTLEDVMLELYVRANILASRKQIQEGKGLSLAEARKELNTWFRSRSLLNSSPS